MDLKDSRLIYLKGFLFLFMGTAAVAILLVEHPEVRFALLLGIAIWSFCRFYYFAFYVISHYVDDRFKFAGLISFAEYLLTGRAVPRGTPTADEAGGAVTHPRLGFRSEQKLTSAPDDRPNHQIGDSK